MEPVAGVVICYNHKKFQSENKVDTLGIEPNTSRMLSERDNQLHHVPVKVNEMLAVISKW